MAGEIACFLCSGDGHVEPACCVAPDCTFEPGPPELDICGHQRRSGRIIYSPVAKKCWGFDLRSGRLG